MTSTAPPQIRRLAEVFTDGSAPLAKLVAHTQRLRELDASLKSFLEADLKDKASVGACDGRTLVVYAASSAWAARLRYASRRLLKYFRSVPGLEGLQALRVRVAPPPATAPRAAAAPGLSPSAAEGLRATAQHITDPQLRATLGRLAAHARGRR